MTLGNEGNTANIPQVRVYQLDEDDRVRMGVALVLGKLIEQKTVNEDVKEAIDSLGILTRDSSSMVRKKAVKSLGKIRSESVIPFLESALKDSNLEVISIASSILQNYKRYSPFSQDIQGKQLPDNSSLKEQNP